MRRSRDQILIEVHAVAIADVVNVIDHNDVPARLLRLAQAGNEAGEIDPLLLIDPNEILKFVLNMRVKRVDQLRTLADAHRVRAQPAREQGTLRQTW